MKVEIKEVTGVRDGQYLFVSIDMALVFPSVSYVRNKINKAGVREGNSRMPLVLDCSHISSADFTAARGFKAMISDFRSRGQPIIFFNTASSVVDTFLGVNIEEFVVVHSVEEMTQHLRSKSNVFQNLPFSFSHIFYPVLLGQSVDREVDHVVQIRNPSLEQQPLTTSSNNDQQTNHGSNNDDVANASDENLVDTDENNIEEDSNDEQVSDSNKINRSDDE